MPGGGARACPVFWFHVGEGGPYIIPLSNLLEWASRTGFGFPHPSPWSWAMHNSFLGLPKGPNEN